MSQAKKKPQKQASQQIEQGMEMEETNIYMQY